MKVQTLSKALFPPSPLPYNTANGKTVPTIRVIFILRYDTRRVGIQAITVDSRIASSRPPESTCGTNKDIATGAIVQARTEKVEEFPSSFMLMIIPQILQKIQDKKNGPHYYSRTVSKVRMKTTIRIYRC